MVELVDTLDLKSNGHYGRAGSSPASSTNEERPKRKLWFFCALIFAKFIGVKMQGTKIVVLQGLVFSYQHVRMGLTERSEVIPASSTNEWKSPDL